MYSKFYKQCLLKVNRSSVKCIFLQYIFILSDSLPELKKIPISAMSISWWFKPYIIICHNNYKWKVYFKWCKALQWIENYNIITNYFNMLTYHLSFVPKGEDIIGPDIFQPITALPVLIYIIMLQIHTYIKFLMQILKVLDIAYC